MTVPEPERERVVLGDALSSRADASAGDPRGRCLTLKPPPEPWRQTKINFNGWQIHRRLELSASKFRTWRPSPARHYFIFLTDDRSLPQKNCPNLVGCLGFLRIVLQNGFPSGRRAYCMPCPVLWKQIPVEICTLRRIPQVQVFPSAFPDVAQSALSGRTGWLSNSDRNVISLSGQAGWNCDTEGWKTRSPSEAFSREQVVRCCG